MSTANVLVKSQLEMQEEKNRKIIEAEEKRREREQIHMESQIRNTIELAREKKRIIDKDALKVKQMQDKEKEMEKIRIGEINKRNKKRQEQLNEVKQGELKKIRREVRKFKFMVSEFKKELHEGIELYDQNKDDPQRLATASVELQRKKKFLEEMSTLRGEKLEKAKIALETGEYLRGKTPEYIIQQQKYERFWQTVNGRNTENGIALDEKIAEQERLDQERDLLIQSRIEEKRSRVSQVLSQIEENRKKAQRAEKKKMQSVVHEFVEKQIKAIGNRDKNLEEKHKEMQEELKKHREKIKNAIEAKKEHEKKVAKKIKEENKKARTKLQKIQESRQEMMEKIKLKGMAFEEHRHQVLDAHEAIIDHFVGLRDQAHGGREPSDEHSGESQDD